MVNNGEGSSRGNISNINLIDEEPDNSQEIEPNPENHILPMNEDNHEERDSPAHDQEANDEVNLDLMQDDQMIDIEIEIEEEEEHMDFQQPFPWEVEQMEAPIAPPPSEEELSDGDTTEEEETEGTRTMTESSYRAMIEERRQIILELEAEVQFRLGHIQTLEAANNAFAEANDALNEELIIYRHELHEVRGELLERQGKLEETRLELYAAQNRITELELENNRLRSMLSQPINLNKIPSPDHSRKSSPTR